MLRPPEVVEDKAPFLGCELLGYLPADTPVMPIQDDGSFALQKARDLAHGFPAARLAID